MKRLLPCLFLFAAAAASAMTPAEFTALYEKPGKTAADCYKLFEAYRDGDGTEKNSSQARKWVLAAHAAGMISARKDISTLPWRSNGKFKSKADIRIAEVDDATAKSLGQELLSLLDEHFQYTGGINYRKRQEADAATMKEVRRLIAEGADLNVWKADNLRPQHTALYVACANGDFKLAKLLIDHGADPSAVNNQAVTVSFYDDFFLETKENSAKNDDKEAMKISAAYKKGIREMHKREKKYLKEDKAFCSRIVSFLVANGADLKMYSNHGWTLMFSAARNNSSMGVALLAKAGLDPDTPQNPHEYVKAAGPAKEMDYQYQTGYVAQRGVALHFAVDNAETRVVSALVKAGANVNAALQNGKTPSDLAREGIERMKPSMDTNPNAADRFRKFTEIQGILKRAGSKSSAN